MISIKRKNKSLKIFGFGITFLDYEVICSAKNPVYTVIVSVHRKEQPAAGGVMAGTILKEIAENLSEKGAFRP